MTAVVTKDIDWANLGFGYMKTDYRYVSNYKDGKWDEGALIDDPKIRGVYYSWPTALRTYDEATDAEDTRIFCRIPEVSEEEFSQGVVGKERHAFHEEENDYACKSQEGDQGCEVEALFNQFFLQKSVGHEISRKKSDA